MPVAAGNYTVTLTITDRFFNNAVSTSTRTNTVNSTLIVGAAATMTIDAPNQIAAPDFDGVNDRIDLGVQSLLGNLVNGYSVAAWVKPDVVTGTHRVLAGGTWRFGIQGNEIALELSTASGFIPFTSVGAGLKAGEWNHIAAIRRSDNTIEFLLNGRSVGVSVAPVSVLLPSNPWFIGSLSGVANFDGMIRDVGVFGTALSSSQFDLVRNSDISSVTPIAFWRMNEGLGLTVASSAPTAMNGTLINGLGWAHHTYAVEGDVLTYQLGGLPPVNELGTRSVVWSVTPANFTIIPTVDQEELKFRVNGDGPF